jgi:hypothetical protein
MTNFIYFLSRFSAEIRMHREGFRSENLTDKFDDLLNDQNIDHMDLVRILDALSEKLRLLETKQETSTNLNQKISPSETALDTLTCNFKHTCYTAKFNMGSCPCELYQQEK